MLANCIRVSMLRCRLRFRNGSEPRKFLERKQPVALRQTASLGFVGATLDLVIDGWRITSVRPPEKQAVLSSWTEIGWRIGNLAAGAGAYSWPIGLAGALPIFAWAR
jgi:hypothetical protein